jgi:hypothetical protein
MPTFHEELERRTEHFRHYLGLMRQRRAGLTKGNCFIIFEERLDTDDSGLRQLTESKTLIYQSTLEVAGWDITSELNETIILDLPDDGWRGDDSQSRFIQFSFNTRYFDMDIPNTTLYCAEAEQILRHRLGFFYVKDCRQFEHPAEEANRFNPLRKIFTHGDERSAAEDMAYVWFNVWKFPVDWRFYVTASSFHDGIAWEKGVPIE